MHPSDDSERRISVTLGSIERRGPWNVPSELEVNVLWGSVELDLREATLQPGVTTIRVDVKMGNLELIVPPDLAVELAVTPILASAESHLGHAASADPVPVVGTPYRDVGVALRRIRVIGVVKLGNVEVIPARSGECVDDHSLHARRRGHHDHPSHHDAHGDHGHHGRHDRRGDRRARRHARWDALRAERAMWKREMHSSVWGPWWLQARMRRRIFGYLALALVAGFAIGWHVDARPPWYVFVLGFFAVSAVSGAIAFRLTRPLIMMVRAARAIGDGNLDTRIDVDRHRGENRMLAGAINDMAAKIQQQLSDQRQLLAAVSHELRTPLGHMRVLIETARDTQSLAPLEGLDREVLELDDLVGKLLASSRLEFGTVDRHPLDLGTLVTDTATAAGVDPDRIEAMGDVIAPIDPTLVRRALANLLDNARVHGGGAIAVRIERRGMQVAIEVDDAGPGVTSDRKTDAFRAFVPSSAGGLGLGLALVSRIAAAHGGGAWILDRPGGGARVGFGIAS